MTVHPRYIVSLTEAKLADIVVQLRNYVVAYIIPKSGRERPKGRIIAYDLEFLTYIQLLNFS